MLSANGNIDIGLLLKVACVRRSVVFPLAASPQKRRVAGPVPVSLSVFYAEKRGPVSTTLGACPASFAALQHKSR
jgi:hypothetical protein